MTGDSRIRPCAPLGTVRILQDDIRVKDQLRARQTVYSCTAEECNIAFSSLNNGIEFTWSNDS